MCEIVIANTRARGLMTSTELSISCQVTLCAAALQVRYDS